MQWSSALPAQFDPNSWRHHPETESYRAALAVLSYSTRTIINRPALCRTERQITHQSDESVDAGHDTAQRCVHAARAMLQFLPGERKGINLRESPLWWVCIMCSNSFSISPRDLDIYQSLIVAKTCCGLDASQRQITDLKFDTDNPTPHQTFSHCPPT